MERINDLPVLFARGGVKMSILIEKSMGTVLMD